MQKEKYRVWYGLKEDNTLIAVKFIDHYPSVSDFGVPRQKGKKYQIVGVRVRETGVLA